MRDCAIASVSRKPVLVGESDPFYWGLASEGRCVSVHPVEHDDPVAFRQFIHEAADREILEEGAVAVDKYYGVERGSRDRRAVRNAARRHNEAVWFPSG